jgi:hypothetical protein
MPQPVEQLIEDIQSRIDYWRKEASLTYAETIGAIEIIKADLIKEMQEQEDDLR